MKKSIFLFALLFLAFSVEFVYSQDTLWTRRYDIPGFIRNAIFSPDDSKILVTGTETFFEVNPQNGEMIREMPELAGRGLRHVEPDKNIGINYACQLVDLNDYKVIKQIVDTNKYKVPTLFDFAYTNDLTRVAFALKNIIVIDVLSGTEIILEQEFPDFETVLRMDLSPDGKYLALWSYYYELIDEEDLTKNHHYNMIKILDIGTNTILKKFSFPDNNQSPGDVSLEFSPDGSMLAVRRAGIDVYTVPDLEFVNNFQFIPQTGGIFDYQFSQDNFSLFLSGPIRPIQEINIKNKILINEYIFRYSTGFLSFPNSQFNRIIAGSTGGLMLYPYLKTSIPKDNITQTIYPSPTTGQLILKLPIFQFSSFKISILNTSGQRVYSNDYQPTNEDININVSHYPKGIYFINIENNNKILQTLKFIKE